MNEIRHRPRSDRAEAVPPIGEGKQALRGKARSTSVMAKLLDGYGPRPEGRPVAAQERLYSSPTSIETPTSEPYSVHDPS